MSVRLKQDFFTNLSATFTQHLTQIFCYEKIASQLVASCIYTSHCRHVPAGSLQFVQAQMQLPAFLKELVHAGNGGYLEAVLKPRTRY